MDDESKIVREITGLVFNTTNCQNLNIQFNVEKLFEKLVKWK